MTASPDSPRALSPTRKRVFTLIAVLLPFIILALLELGLRIAGFGKDLPLFISEGAPAGYLQPNPRVVERYFPHPSLAPKVSPDTVFFKAEKAADSFRIVVQGGSTAAGFPYGRWGSLQGMLDQRFKKLYPDHTIEVINTAMSAVNSYTLLDFVDEIIEQEPDLVMIYAGHNEYLGILGAGSVYGGESGRAATLMYLKLNSLKLVQLLERVMFALRGSPGETLDKNRSLMAQVASGKEIPFNSALYQAGIAQFDGNLSLILQKYRRAGIPVMLGTLASNEKDQVPFNSVKDTDWQAFEVALADPVTRPKTADFAVDNAAEQFKRAKVLLANGNIGEARSAFQRARDLDSLRFRAPSAFNEIIRRHTEAEGVYLADVDAFIRKDTREEIIGHGHMLEHLHPNVRGYFLLAEAYVATLLKYRKPLGLPAPAARIAREEAWREVPVTAVASRYGQYKIDGLVADYPFTAHPLPKPQLSGDDFESKALQATAMGEDWLRVQQGLLRDYQVAKNMREAAKIAGTLSDAMIFDPKVAAVAASLYRDIDEPALAGFYFRRAWLLQPKNTEYMLNLAHAYYLNRNIDRSLAMLQSVLDIDPANKNARHYLAKLSKEKNAVMP